MTVMQRVRALERLARTAVRFADQMATLAEDAGVEVGSFMAKPPKSKKRGRPAGAKGKRKVRARDASPARPDGPDDGDAGGERYSQRDPDNPRYSQRDPDNPPF
jgi:hypothetical protein